MSTDRSEADRDPAKRRRRLSSVARQGASLVNQAISNPLAREQKANYVPCTFLIREAVMLRVFVEEAAALASIGLFVGMIAIWAQVIPNL
jgi:hypothetical protein